MTCRPCSHHRAAEFAEVDLSGDRLVTWNLFFSASAYERQEPLDWTVVDDLSALIDLLALSDSVRVIGDPQHPPFRSHEGYFFKMLRESGAMQIALPQNERANSLSTLTIRHLRLAAPYVAEKTLRQWTSEALRLNAVAPEREQLAAMNIDVRLNPPDFGPAPGGSQGAFRLDEAEPALRSYVVRTYMYYSYGELERIPFVPDAARKPLVGAVVTGERDLARQIIEAIGEQWRTHPQLVVSDLRERISPFSAVVFERCRGDRRGLPYEILRLREELADVRKNLSQQERRILYADGSRNGTVAAERRWNAILAELESAYGPSPSVFTFDRGVALAGSAAAVIEAPRSPAGPLNLVAMSARALVRHLRRRPVAQLHDMRASLPSASRLRASTQSLFPELRD